MELPTIEFHVKRCIKPLSAKYGIAIKITNL